MAFVQPGSFKPFVNDLPVCVCVCVCVCVRACARALLRVHVCLRGLATQSVLAAQLCFSLRRSK